MAEGGIPGIGKVSKNEWYLFGGAAVVVVGIAWYRHSKNKAAATAAASNATNASADPNLDPATGYDYGTPQDTAALAGGYGYSGYGGGGGYYGSGVPANTTPQISTNAQWAQAYEEYAISNQLGDATTVAAALGKYLTGQQLTTDQVNIVEQAIAFVGQPPQAGTNGFPPSFHTTSAPPGGGGGGLPVLKPGIEIHVEYDIPPNGIAAVAAKFGISPQHIMSLAENAGKNPNGGGVYFIPYRTQPSDTLVGVAAKFGISPQHLAEYIPAS